MLAIVIPAHLRTRWDRDCLTRLLRAVGSQDGLGAVVVVDDASPVAPDQVEPPVEVLRLASNAGPARARNAGMARALELGATVILMTDHDCLPEPGWARALERHLASTGDGAVGGITRALGDTALDRFHDLNGTLNGRWILPCRKELLYAPTCNFAIRADLARQLQFDERYRGAAGEDVDFCLRLRRQHRIGLCREAVVRHDFGYRGSLTGLPRFVGTFLKYRAANETLWREHAAHAQAPSESISSVAP